LGRNDAVGFDVQNELVQVSALFNTCAFDSVADAANRAVRGVQQNAPDGVGTVVRQGADVAGHVAATLFDLDMDFQLACIRQISNDMIRIDDFHVMRQFDIAGQDHAGTFLAQHQGNVFLIVQLEYHALQVQQDVNDVFPYT